MQASFRVILTADELINDIDWTVRIPGFGQFVVELTGVSDCNCTGNPVWLLNHADHYSLLIITMYTGG